MTVVAWLLALGATIRVTRLITREQFPPAVWFRLAVMKVFGSESEWYVLVTCPWCLSMWLGVGLFTLAWFYGTTVWFLIACSALTASMFTGLVLTELDINDVK